MRRLFFTLATLVLVLVATPADAEPSGLTVTLSPTSVAVPVGEVFTVQATVRNDRSATAPLLAHIDVVGLQSDVYVDPEDWSDSRSQFLPVLGAGESTTVTWAVKAVNAGRFDVHVVVLRVLPAGAGPVAVSTPIYVTVTAHRSLDAGGSLGVVLGVPAVLGLAALLPRTSGRRRHASPVAVANR
jgi:hypothetical protein